MERKGVKKETGKAGPKTRSKPKAKAKSGTTAKTRSFAKAKTRSKPRITHADISKRAYEIYLQREPHEGTPEDDWFRAEEDLFSDPGI